MANNSKLRNSQIVLIEAVELGLFGLYKFFLILLLIGYEREIKLQFM